MPAKKKRTSAKKTVARKPASQKTSQEKVRPAGVTVIAVLYIIFGSMLLIAGALLLVVIPFFDEVSGEIQDQLTAEGILFVVTEIVIICIALVVIGLAILLLFVGIGLWKGSVVARLVVLILQAISLFSTSSSLLFGNVGGILNLVLPGLIFWYLGFSKEAKDYFGVKGFWN